MRVTNEHGLPDHKTESDLLSRLPGDLMLFMLKSSACSTTTYIQLLGISHALRDQIRGSVQELSFGDLMASPPTEALTALICPCNCKGLTKLSLENQWIPLLESGTEAACIAWVDETFAGHRPGTLSTLQVPVPLFQALDHRGLLSGLESLTLEQGGDIDDELLATVCRACPRLCALRAPEPQTAGDPRVPLRLCHQDYIPPVLAANQATLRSLTLRQCDDSKTLFALPDKPTDALLSPALVNQLR
ncbi:hypothetical protein PAPYR_6626 [Paratrimastix pyriformis]|uniref:Uncharacterized protein n=1 Tax=Paratrimastix pyriformis TaxID=342808 RepID=A0ABQ8UEU8_9EUKA|nr:hypothetical protein PAPYR_6626 [Paratrimastix pyriformis]